MPVSVYRRPQRFLLLDCFSKSDWYGPELHGDYGLFRWTGPGSVSTIDLPVSLDQNLSIRIHVIQTLAHDALETLQILVNSEPVRVTAKRTADATYIVSGLVPSGRATTGGARVAIKLNRTIRPIDIGVGHDERSLGIAVNWIEFTGLPATSDDFDTEFDRQQVMPRGGEPGNHAPILSVAIPTASSWGEIRYKIAPIIEQAWAIAAEVIVANGEREPTWPAELCTRVKWLWLPGANIFELRAAASSSATGDIVAITEDHCVPAGDWCQRILNTYAADERCIVVGGATLNGSESTLMDAANFTTTFSRYSPSALTAPIPSISNLAVRRDWLPANFPPGWLEFDFLPAISRVRGTIRMCPDIVVTHFQSSGFWKTIATHFHNGRASGNFLPRQPAQGRLLRAIWEGGVHAHNMLWATCRALRQTAHPVSILGARMVLAATLILSHSTGIVFGLTWGAGDSADHIN